MTSNLPTTTPRRTLVRRIGGSAIAPAVVAGGAYLAFAPAKYEAVKAFLMGLGLAPGATIAVLVPVVLGSIWVGARFMLGRDGATPPDDARR